MQKTIVLINRTSTSCSSAVALPGAVGKGGLDGRVNVGLDVQQNDSAADIDGDRDTLVNQRPYRFKRFTKWQTTSTHTTTSLGYTAQNDLTWRLTSTSISVLTPLDEERRGPAQDPVHILENPWVHEQDEVVAALQLPSPIFSPNDTVMPPEPETNHILNQVPVFHQSVESLGGGLVPLPMAVHDTCDNPSPSKYHNHPLYLFDLIILACTLKRAKPKYNVLTSNCYWYCAMILHLVRLRHGLNLPRIHIPERNSVLISLKPQKLRQPLPELLPKSAPSTDTSADKTGKPSQKWKLKPKRKKNVIEEDWDRHQIPVPSFTDPSVPTSSSPSPLLPLWDLSPSWCSYKLGTWYGIRVSKTPTDQCLHKWLTRAEEAIEWLRSEVFSDHKLILQDGPVVNMKVATADAGSAVLLTDFSRSVQSDGLTLEEDGHGCVAPAVTYNWSGYCSSSSSTIEISDPVSFGESTGWQDDFYDGLLGSLFSS